jgi:hypothetical protein
MVLTKEQIIIPKDKLTEYLLVFKERNDTSIFLKELGFNKDNWEDLAIAIADLALANEIEFHKKSMYGDLYTIRGMLNGLSMVTIWFHLEPSNQFRFVTLFPEK